MARVPYYIREQKSYPTTDGYNLVEYRDGNKIVYERETGFSKKRMLSLSNNLDGLRSYGWTAEFYNLTPLENIANFKKIELAVKSVDIPEITSKVTHMSMCGYSGQSITTHVDKTFKMIVQQLVVDDLLTYLKANNYIMTLGDSRHTNFNQNPTGSGGTPGPAIPTTVKTFDVKLNRYTGDGEFHHAYAFTDCKIVGFKQSQLNYSATSEMSELELSLVFDEMFLADRFEYDKSPSYLKKSVDDEKQTG